ncbi:hypothetical protein BV898_04083 [Hypsibius exemplaris]|uniref:G-protein coupled receptors family 1 profile domain-containing protein n=1 Tax=Hypsibius exemplaris TaxID=2072580 RepID=A0A1W0X313_HYPEX|nr:hypothetical protein BV898_04083 [Hypsibius exemplaris]
MELNLTLLANDASEELAGTGNVSQHAWIRAYKQASGLVCAAVGIAGTIGSILLMILICRQRRELRSSIDQLYINIAVTTLVFSVVSCPLHAYTAIVGRSNFLATSRYAGLCQAAGFIYREIIAVDFLIHASIALHRFFIVVVTVNRFPWLRSRVCAGIFVITPWLVAAVVLVFPLFGLGVKYGYTHQFDRCAFTYTSSSSLVYFRFCMIFFTFVALTVNVACYSAILVKLILTRRRQMRIVPRWQARLVSRYQMERERTVTKTAFAMCLVFMVCALPPGIFSLSASVRDLESPLFRALIILFSIGSVTSAWMIILTTPGLRTTFIDCIKRRHPTAETRNHEMVNMTNRTRHIQL